MAPAAVDDAIYDLGETAEIVEDLESRGDLRLILATEIFQHIIHHTDNFFMTFDKK